MANHIEFGVGVDPSEIIIGDLLDSLVDVGDEIGVDLVALIVGKRYGKRFLRGLAQTFLCFRIGADEVAQIRDEADKWWEAEVVGGVALVRRISAFQEKDLGFETTC